MGDLLQAILAAQHAIKEGGDRGNLHINDVVHTP